MPDRTPNLNFLPPNYVALRRQWRRAQLQVAAVGLLTAGLLLGVGRVRSELARANEEIAKVNREIASAQGDQRWLESLTQLRDQWRRQDHLFASSGTHIESSRLLLALERVIPADTVLTDLAFKLPGHDENSETNSLGDADGSTSTTGMNPSSGNPRKLKVTLGGRAPGDASVENLLVALRKTPVFEHVNLTRATNRADRSGDGPAREFEVTFQITLPGEEGVASATTEAIH